MPSQYVYVVINRWTQNVEKHDVKKELDCIFANEEDAKEKVEEMNYLKKRMYHYPCQFVYSYYRMKVLESVDDNDNDSVKSEYSDNQDIDPFETRPDTLVEGDNVAPIGGVPDQVPSSF